MDNFDFKKYLTEGRIHQDSNINEKQDSKKGNSEEQKRAEGAIKDDRDHIKALKKDIEDQERKLAKLKKDYKKDVVKEAKKQGYNDELDDSEGAKHGKKKQDMKQRRADSENMEKAAGKRKFSGDKSKDKVKEGYGKKYEEDDVDAMSEEMKDESSSKMKKEDLKARIRETILAELSEEGGYKADDAGAQYHDSLYTEAEEDVDVDVDFEDEVNIDAEGDDIEIERPAVKAKVNVGLSPEEEIIQDSLKAAMDAANALGNDKLADQVGNTITFFTREYVVGDRND